MLIGITKAISRWAFNWAWAFTGKCKRKKKPTLNGGDCRRGNVSSPFYQFCFSSNLPLIISFCISFVWIMLLVNDQLISHMFHLSCSLSSMHLCLLHVIYVSLSVIHTLSSYMHISSFTMLCPFIKVYSSLCPFTRSSIYTLQLISGGIRTHATCCRETGVIFTNH